MLLDGVHSLFVFLFVSTHHPALKECSYNKRTNSEADIHAALKSKYARLATLSVKLLLAALRKVKTKDHKERTVTPPKLRLGHKGKEEITKNVHIFFFLLDMTGR